MRQRLCPDDSSTCGTPFSFIIFGLSHMEIVLDLRVGFPCERPIMNGRRSQVDIISVIKIGRPAATVFLCLGVAAGPDQSYDSSPTGEK